jgi:pSer/pThr/pTyr-binding forkhead associated (FHA) protein
VPFLTYLDDEGRKVHELTTPSVTVGRLASCNITVKNQRVSRVHGRFERSFLGWYFIDGGGQNGSWVNGKFLKPNEKQKLQSSDLVRVGGVEIQFLDILPASIRNEMSKGAGPNTGMGASTPVARPASKPMLRTVDATPISPMEAVDVRNPPSGRTGALAEQGSAEILEAFEEIEDEVDPFADNTVSKSGMIPVDEEMMRTLFVSRKEVGVNRTAEIRDRIVELIRGEPDSNKLYRLVVRACADFLSGDRSLLAMANGPKLNFKAVKWLTPDEVGSKLNAIIPLTIRQVVTNGKPLLLQNVSSQPKLKSITGPEGARIRSIVCAPLTLPGLSTIGAIYVDSVSQGNHFTAQDSAALREISNVVVHAVVDRSKGKPH